MSLALAAIAGATTLIGGGMGVASVFQGAFQEKAALRRQMRNAWQQYLLGKSYSDTQYAIQQGESAYQLADQERRLNQEMGQAVDQYNTGLLAQAFATQDARIQTASNIGSSLAAEGMSGTRGNDANGLVRAYAQQGLERGIEIQNRQNQAALTGMVSGANNALRSIARERDSWSSGGYRYEMKEAQDDYNLQMAKLGQDNFSWQIDQASPTGLDITMGLFGGLSSGFSLGTSIYNLGQFFGGGGGSGGGTLGLPLGGNISINNIADYGPVKNNAWNFKGPLP
jgi:hypothetical protein